MSFPPVVLLTLLGIVVASAADEVEIGSFYRCAHGLRGKVFAKNDREIVIREFHYDGKGPSAWFHAQIRGSKGIYTSDPDMYVTVPYPNATCDRLKPGRSYKNEVVTVILPQSIKEFETFGVFCYEYCHNFGHVIIPSDLSVPTAPSDLLQVKGCPKPKYRECHLETTKFR